MKRKKESAIIALLAKPWWVSGLLAAGALLIPYIVKFIFPSGSTQSGIAFKNNIVTGAELLSLLLAGGLLIIALYVLAKELFAKKPQTSATSRRQSVTAKEAAANETPVQVAPAADIPEKPPLSWSRELLQSLNKNQFKTLCEALFNDLGLLARSSDCGADFDLYPGSSPEDPVAIAKCKSSTYPVNARDVLEFCGIVDQTGIGKAYFVTASSFTADARNFATTCDLSLISGKQLLKLISSRSQEKSAELLKLATADEQLPVD
ncbi:Restriction endonuclease [Mariprofundus aestuarium]|uniref:Restriction endonuclease n=1 Tax=Mariprofundus aestuarium TaxID=1921086 RepID=A0A2K8L343_MARES|nr:restriction endonuclease [Mariprofundus aestuarium]ATX80639.1 Restriction endonuclease [Mariprofundus aestuarium]